MRKVKGMRKSQAKERMLFVVGVIVICLLALVFVVRFISPSLESSREGQAKVLANMIAIYANTLSTMDQGRFEKDLGLKEPMIVEITKESGVSMVKVVYDRASGKSYKTPILADIEPVPAKEIQKLTILKDITGKISVEGEIKDWYYTPAGDVPCAEPSTEDKIKYIQDAANEFQVEEALIKAVMKEESSFMHCKNGYLNVNRASGASGLMQLLPSTAAELGVNYKDAADNVRGGAKYLSQLTKQFKGDKRLALAAYNCGPGNIRYLLDNYGNSWEAHLTEKCTRKTGAGYYETQKYVVDVMAYYQSCSIACSPKDCLAC